MQSTSTHTDWLDLATKALVVIGAVSTGAWVILRPAWFSLFRWTARKVLRVQDEQGKNVAMADVIPRLAMLVRDIQADVRDMKEESLVRNKLLDSLPGIQRDSADAIEAVKRVEQTLGEINRNILALTEKVGVVQGRQQP